MEQFGGGIPEKERKYLDITRAENGDVQVDFDRSVPLPPVLLHDRRKAILRAGKAREPTVAALDFTKRCGHYHAPAQTLLVHACKQELASDLGYMGAQHFLTRDWIRTYPAHNCLTMRAADGDPGMTEKLRGDLRKHFIRTPTCQVVDVAEYDEADWKDAREKQVREFSRQIVVMTPSADHQYVVDIVRGKGGAVHDYYLHCHGLGFQTEDIELQPVVDPEQDLYDHSGWDFKCRNKWGSHNIRELAVAEADGPWQATWSKIDDYRNRPEGEAIIHDDVFMRLWMLDEPGTEVIVGTAPAQRYLDNRDRGRTMKVLCARRPNTDAINAFVGVIEPYRDTPFIEDVTSVAISSEDEYTLALRVDTVHGTDYIISYGGSGEPDEIELHNNSHVISTDGDLAVVSFPDGRSEPQLLLAGGSYLRTDTHELTVEEPPMLTGRLLDFNDAEDTLTIESSATWPFGEALAGQPIIVQHSEDRSTFTIESIEVLAKDRYLLRLDDHPHLMDNRLVVRDVDGTGITVEPPPVLDYKQRTYKVYSKPGEDSPRMLGPLRDVRVAKVRNEWAATMHAFYRVVTDDHGGVEAGEEIGITRLEKGHDTVQLTRYAYRDYGKKKAEPAASSDRSDTPETPEPATAPEADLGAILAEALSLKGQGEYAATIWNMWEFTPPADARSPRLAVRPRSRAGRWP